MARKRAKRRRTSAKRRRKVSGTNYLSPNVVSGVGRRKKKSHRRRGRVGYVTGNEAGDTLVGAILGVGVGILFDKFAPITNPVISDGIKTAGGGAAYVMVKKSAIVKGAGLGLAIYGAGALVKSSGLLSGMEDFVRGMGKSDELLIEMNGTDEVLNSTNMIGGGQSDFAPGIVSGENDVDGESRVPMPSVVSGY